jgi:hypothetical protein
MDFQNYCALTLLLILVGSNVLQIKKIFPILHALLWSNYVAFYLVIGYKLEYIGLYMFTLLTAPYCIRAVCSATHHGMGSGINKSSSSPR